MNVKQIFRKCITRPPDYDRKTLTLISTYALAICICNSVEKISDTASRALFSHHKQQQQQIIPKIIRVRTHTSTVTTAIRMHRFSGSRDSQEPLTATRIQQAQKKTSNKVKI